MSTLLLRLAGPMQAWGVDSKFDIRQSGLVPSKSGVLGMIAAALGRKREDSIDDLVTLRFGVRVINAGTMICDYHTVSRNPDAPRSERKTDYLTKRYYLSDASFIAGLETSDEAFLETILWALKHPVYPLFLGRRSCPPSFPLVLGIRQEELSEALIHIHADGERGTEEKQIKLIMDSEKPEDTLSMIRDLPKSFSASRRDYGFRPVTMKYAELDRTEHDPFAELED